jgi:hypothetical protein
MPNQVGISTPGSYIYRLCTLLTVAEPRVLMANGPLDIVRDHNATVGYK